MNTDKHSHKKSFLVPLLSVLFYWGFVICLALLLFLASTHRGGGLGGSGGGTGTGNGTVDGNGNGSGNGSGYENGSGHNNGTAGRSGKQAPASQSKEPGAGNTAAETNEKDAQEVTKDPPKTPPPPTNTEKTGQGGEADESGNSDEEAGLEKSNSQPAQIAIAKPKEEKKTYQKPKKKGNVHIVKGSEAGNMKGFFGSGEIVGNVLFLLDVSSSMAGCTPEGLNRLELVKREMKKILQQKLDELDQPPPKTKGFDIAPSYKKFIIATFSCSTSFYPDNNKTFSFGSKKDLKDAIDCVDKLQPGGGTAMKGALNDCAPICRKKNIDCLYLLSDGEPTDGGIQDLLSAAKPIHGRIHTFSMGTKADLLKELAQKHKGKYTEIY